MTLGGQYDTVAVSCEVMAERVHRDVEDAGVMLGAYEKRSRAWEKKPAEMLLNVYVLSAGRPSGRTRLRRIISAVSSVSALTSRMRRSGRTCERNSKKVALAEADGVVNRRQHIIPHQRLERVGPPREDAIAIVVFVFDTGGYRPFRRDLKDLLVTLINHGVASRRWQIDRGHGVLLEDRTRALPSTADLQIPPTAEPIRVSGAHLQVADAVRQ